MLIYFPTTCAMIWQPIYWPQQLACSTHLLVKAHNTM